MTGDKPSTGKIYPFLHELKEKGYAIEIDEVEDNRGTTKYHLSKEGIELIDDVLSRMGNLIEARLEQLLESCYHCGIKLYGPKVYGKGKEGKKQAFCCTHCRDSYLEH